MEEDKSGILAERLKNLADGFAEFKADVKAQLATVATEIKQSNMATMENAARDREQWTRVLKENTQEIMGTVAAMQAKSEEASKERLAEYAKKIAELEKKGTSTRELLLKIVGGILAIIGMWALLQNFFGSLKHFQQLTPPPSPPGKTMHLLPPVAPQMPPLQRQAQRPCPHVP